MHRPAILKLIDSYQREWGRLATELHAPYAAAAEAPVLDRFRAFINATPDCCERDSPLGHLTGSALVVTPALDQVLLTLHRKLGKWLQLGGHADGSPLLHEVAMREANEESGLKALHFLPYEKTLLAHQAAASGGMTEPMPFDFDAHAIPARPGEPAHVHYDVRFLIVANRLDPLIISEESRDLRWFTVAAARQTSGQEPSMERQFLKLAWLKQQLTVNHKVLS